MHKSSSVMLPSVQKSFFGRFKNRIKTEGDQDPGGRYFAVLLEQLFFEVPDALTGLLFPGRRPKEFHGARVSTEFRFVSKRRADLAFFDSNDNVVGLVEIKEEDQLGPGSGRQVKDYLKYVTKNSINGKRVHFAYITKHLPSSESVGELTKNNIQPIFYTLPKSSLESEYQFYIRVS